MEKELCPMCKSEQTIYHESGPYSGRWLCMYQGCDGKLGNDKYFWTPGNGLPPKKPKPKKSAEPATTEG